ncbi:MAG: methyltransferase domain-containing protein [Alphaproteobacteria bacterium]|nr:methyltransferase domain-containing protein [Alphaproteobacteria bacterium]
MPNPYIFDRHRHRLHKNRAAENFAEHDFLLREMTGRLAERLECVKRSFPLALDVGSRGILGEILAGRGGVQTLVQMDLSQPIFRHPGVGRDPRLVADEEFLPFAENSFDLVMACGNLHWVNDLPGALIQMFRALKPDGMFLAILPGAQTLKELRAAMEQAEMEISGGVSPRVSPFVDVRDSGALLQRAGFALPVIDSEILTVRYEHPFSLLKDLRGMGETSALLQGKKGMAAKALIPLAMEKYGAAHTGDDGRVAATFELVTLTGWKP